MFSLSLHIIVLLLLLMIIVIINRTYYYYDPYIYRYIHTYDFSAYLASLFGTWGLPAGSVVAWPHLWESVQRRGLVLAELVDEV